METLKIACYVVGTVLFFASMGLTVAGLATVIKRKLRDN